MSDLLIMSDTLNKSILFVEDEAAQREPLVEMLSGSGFTVFQAPDGKQGLEIAIKEHPDLILLDLIMPEMDGVSFMRTLRRDNWGANVPLIMFTNVSPDTENTIKTINEFKPSFYLTKGDLTLDEIVLKIKEVLDIPSH